MKSFELKWGSIPEEVSTKKNIYVIFITQFIVLIFILAAILTPPDVLSQIALAIPLILLYEISILICKIIDKRGARNARHQMD